MTAHTKPALHNAMWPGLVGKGPDSEPPIDLDTMLDLTAAANVDGARFEGVDLFLFDPHVDIDSDRETLKRLADRISARGFVVGSLVAPVWPPTGGGSAMGGDEERKRFLTQVRKACAHRQDPSRARHPPLRRRADRLGRQSGRLGEDPAGNTKRIAETFREAGAIAVDHGERLAAEGEICWGGMHSWKRMLELLEMVGRPGTVWLSGRHGAHAAVHDGLQRARGRLLPEGYDWSDRDTLDRAIKTMTDALRPWTIDFHVAQNDATVKGSGSHDKTGRHCLPKDPNGKMDIVRVAGAWMRDESGTRRARSSTSAGTGACSRTPR